MTSRGRVSLVLEHKQPDRVPIDLWGSACRIHTNLYKKIADHLNYSEYKDLLRPGSTTEYVDYRLSDEVDIDFRHINIGRPENFTNYIDEYENTIDEWGIGRKLISNYNTITYHPLQEATIEDLKKYKWPIAKDKGRIQGLREKAKYWHEKTDYAITATSAVSGLFFELAQYLRGSEKFLMDLYLDPKFAHALIEKLTEVITEINLYYLEPIAEYIEWIEFTEDIAMQRNLFVSREIFKEFFDKPHKAIFSAIKKRYPHIKIFFHSCGAMSPMIPDIIDWGVDILNPLQPLAYGMDLLKIKKEYGKDVVLHGGIDIQQAMIGTESDVKKEVEERVNVLAEGGGYILAPTNHLQIDVPVENFFTLYNYANIYSKKFYSGR